MNQIDLKVKGVGGQEFEMAVVPKIGEKLSVDLEYLKGNFVVTDVIYRVFTTATSFSKEKKILTYAEVHAKPYDTTI